MAYFPLFIDLSGKETLIVGGGKVAERKVQILLNFGASILLISPETTSPINVLIDSGAITFCKREYRSEDILSAVLAIAATGNREINRQIYNDAVCKGIPVNVVDDPELCTFVFPSVVQRNDLVIGITTSGSYPALSKYVRKKLEAIFPVNYGEFVSILKKYRKKIRREIKNPIKRKQVLKDLLEIAVQAAESGEIYNEQRLISLLDIAYEKMDNK